MAFSSANELLQWLADNQFLPAPAAEELRNNISTWPDAVALTKHLVQRDWLKPYQANQILQDRADSLILGPFRFLERLGEGAMGQVLKAWNVRMGRFAAIKMILKDLMTSNKARDRFRREMETASQLDHPNIVLVRDAGEVDGRPFIVMDFVEGMTLAKLVKTEGPLPIPVACEYARQAALGLQHAFERDVIHRDIKPGNLLLTRSANGEPGTVKIMDFGLARWNSDRDEMKLTQMGNILGTVDYISPEQAEDAHKADIRSDIFSLGCTLFYLLTGRPPFPGNSVVEKVSSRLLGEWISLRSLRPEAPPELEAVIGKMLARHSKDRYQTPQDVAEALRPFTAAAPAALPPAPAPFPQAGPGLALPVGTIPPPPPLMPFFPPPVDDRALFRFEDSGSVEVLPSSPAPPVAKPVVAAPVSPSPMASPIQAMPGPADPAAGSFAEDPAPFPPSRTIARAGLVGRMPTWLLLGGTLVLLVGAILGTVILIQWLFPSKPSGPKYPGGILKITQVDNLKLSPFRKNLLIVRIERTRFNGPVLVKLKGPGDVLQTREVRIPAGKETAEFPVILNFDKSLVGRPLQATLEASAEELRAEFPLNLTVNPK